MFARNALDLPVPTEFTYSVPAELVDTLRPGQRVRVPFRRTTRVGYCVALEPTTEIEKTRDIASVLDPEPLVDADLLELARWMTRPPYMSVRSLFAQVQFLGHNGLDNRVYNA